MGKKSGNSWLNAVKKAFRSPSNDDDKRKSSARTREDQNELEEEEKKRGKRRWIFRKHHSPIETTIQHNVAKANSAPLNINYISDQRRAIAAAVATAAAAEAAVATAVEILRLSSQIPLPSVKQHQAALLIQTIFRGYLARRALLALKGVVKLQALIRGYTVRKRAKMTLQCIQSLVRVQALVCDQRRRLSCEATNLDHNINSRNRDRGSCNLDIEALIEKAEECSVRQGRTLAHILSKQMQSNEDRYSEEIDDQDQFRKDWNLRITPPQKDLIKTVEIDTSRPYLYASPKKNNWNRSVQSPKTPSSSSKTESFQGHNSSCSPRYQVQRMSITSESCCGQMGQPGYMAATASAMARVRSHSTPRQRPLSPRKDQAGSAKKRLSFPGPVQRFNVPDYSTE